MERTIVIGDVHGCFDELQDLLSAVEAGPGDRLISVGDLICKGPDSDAVLDWAMRTPNLRVVLGNHEHRFLRYWRLGLAPDEKPYDLETYRQLGRRYDRFMRFIDGWPTWLKGEGWIVVHAGFDPRVPMAEQSVMDLTNIRRLPKSDIPWYDLYRGSELVVFGHWVRREPLVLDNVVGLDTGCVYGGALTALVLPERRLVSVPARKVYRRKEAWLVSAGQ